MAGIVFQRGVFQRNVFQMGTPLTSTATLQLPVDYALAGEQHEEPGRRRKQSVFRSGRIAGRALRHVFSE